MTRNNICNSLIVYGSWAPGGKNHHLVQDLPGDWKKGIMLAGNGSSGDNLYPGENIKIESWIIKFSDCLAEMFTEEWEAQKVMLFDRWTELDAKMGRDLGRDQRSWWPKKVKWWHKENEPIRGKNGQQVINVYLPIQNFSHLKNLYDTPRPEDEKDIKKLWLQQLSGEKKYEVHQFISLIKDFTFPECREMFSTLPNIDPFLSKLSNLYNDMAYDSGYLLKQTNEGFHLYAIPIPEHVISSDEAIEIVKKDLQQKSNILEINGNNTKSALLKKVDFEVGKPPEIESNNYETEDAFEEVNELINEPSYNLKDHWKYCLSEACYGIASNYAVRDFLMSDFYKINYDFNIPYQLWKGGWKYELHKATCYIFIK